MKKVALVPVVTLLIVAGCKRDQTPTAAPTGQGPTMTTASSTPTPTTTTTTPKTGGPITTFPLRKEELLLTFPKEMSVEAGSSTALKVEITRKQFDDPVTVKFSDVPDDVKIDPPEIKIAKGDTDATFTVKVDAKAKEAKGSVIKIAAEGGGQKVAPQDIKLNILAKKTDLTLQVKELQETIRPKLKETDEAIAKLKEKAKTATGDTKTALDKELSNLETRRKDLQKQLDQAGKTSAEAWEAFARGVHNAADQLGDAAKKALDKFKQ
jgi:hypothetical protein